MLTQVEQFQHFNYRLAVLSKTKADLAADGFLLQKHQELQTGTIDFGDIGKIDLHVFSRA